MIVDRALAILADRGAHAAVVVMGDLPELKSEDLAQLLAALDDADCAFAPDGADAGTNALALRLPPALSTQLGHADSFARHLDAAQHRGLTVTTIRTPSLAHDIDEPGDL